MASEDDLEAQIDEEYKVWKKNSPFLYDIIVTHELEWPSLTVQWFPDKTTPAGKNYSQQRLLLGTNTSGQETDFLMIAEVQLPTAEAEIDARKYSDQDDAGGFGHGGAKIEIKQKFVVEAEVNRARYMPQNPDIIACHTSNPDILVFDRTKHSSFPKQPYQCNPNLRLKGHTKEGFGLSWSLQKEGHLLSGANDFLINLYDLSAVPHEINTLDPIQSFKAHKNVVNDVAFSCLTPNVFGSVGDDGQILLWDIRTETASSSASSSSSSSSDQQFQSAKGHGDGEVMCIAFNPFQEHLFATGCSDNSVHLWDARKLSAPQHTFLSHQEQVVSLHWAPWDETILASASADRRVHVWDTSRIGQEQDPEDAEDGPPELLFVHGGHTDRVGDVCWNPNDEWVISSVSENNVLQVWQMAENIYADDEDDNEEEAAPEDLE